MGKQELERGLQEAEFRHVKAKRCDVRFGVGLAGFTGFFWESHPVSEERIANLGKERIQEVRVAMGRILNEKYEHGRAIPLYTTLMVGQKRSSNQRL